MHILIITFGRGFVIFGTGDGVINHLATGMDTPFVREDGIYLFNMWVPAS